MFNESPEVYGAYGRAAEAIARARETEGTTEAGLWRTAVVESAAAITEALFDLSSSVEGIRFVDPEDFSSIAYRLSDVADAITKLASND